MMNQVQSKDNPRYKHWLRVSSGKVDDEVILEGVHLCQEWMRHQGQPVNAIFDRSKFERSAELQQLALELDPSLSVGLDHGLWSRMSGVAGEGQGVAFVVKPPLPTLPERISENCLWLDRVQDPGNLGTLLRTAAAAGVRQVYVGQGSARVWSAKVLRSAQGAHFALQIFEHLDLVEMTSRLDIPLAITSLDGGHDIFDTGLPKICAWVAGNEGQGVSPALQALAQLRVFIPQSPAVESLNVAVAMALCLYEQFRQHRHH